MGEWQFGPKKIFFSLNWYRAKCSVISFQVGGWVASCMGGQFGAKKTFGFEFVSSQIWCYLTSRVGGGRGSISGHKEASKATNNHTNTDTTVTR